MRSAQAYWLAMLFHAQHGILISLSQLLPVEVLAFKRGKFTSGLSGFGRNWLCQGFSLLAVLLGETETAHPGVKNEDDRTGSLTLSRIYLTPGV